MRVGLAGGGTDLPAYYSRHGGMSVCATIDKYFYAIVNVTRSRDLQITSSDYSTFYRHNRMHSLLLDGDLSLPRAVLHEFGFTSGLSLFLASEVPPGTGLGSSSTATVAIIKALGTLRDLPMTKHEVGDLACRVEIEKLRMPIGKQDQFASSYGGLNVFVFNRDGTVEREPLSLSEETVQGLERRLILFFTGSARNSSVVLREQAASTASGDTGVLASLDWIKAAAQECVLLLRSGRLDDYGELLHESWDHKKRLSRGISNAKIDRWYEIAREGGAIGGKITGAGGGGFLALYCPPEKQEAVDEALEREGLRRLDFQFDFGGARVLMHSARAVPWSSHAVVGA